MMWRPAVTAGRRVIGPLGPAVRLAHSQALVLNSGSSSIKYGVYEVEDKTVRLSCKGIVEGIGSKDVGAHKHCPVGLAEKTEKAMVENHVAGLKKIFACLPQETRDAVKVVGHRVVNGGVKFSTPAVINAEVQAAIEEACSLAPLHNPANLSGILAAQAVWGSIPHVAVFDTSFHATMPPESYRYAVPKEWHDLHGVRRYGFHGTSYGYVLRTVAEELKTPASNLNAIICHLGSGASMVCIKNGQSIDTTMGLTPLEGLVMGTRSGDIDGGVLRHLTKQLGMSVDEVDSALNKKSGLLGLCGMADMRSVHKAALEGNADAALAEKIFVERVRKYLGAYMLKLNGNLDALVFTAGIGENAPWIREMVCEGLEQFGIKLDPMMNTAPSRPSSRIEAAFSRTKIMVVPTDEELSIALQSVELVRTPEQQPVKEAEPVAPAKVSALHTAHDLMVVGWNEAEEMGLASVIFPQIINGGGRCGYFRCFTDHDEDSQIDLMKKEFYLDDTFEEMRGITIQEAIKLGTTSGNYREVMDRILAKFNAYKKGKDFVLIGGNHVTQTGHNLCVEFASTVGAPIVLVRNAKPRGAPIQATVRRTEATSDDAGKAVLNLWQSHKAVTDAGGQVEGAIVAGIHSSLADEVRAGLKKNGITPIAITPSDPVLDSSTVEELARQMGASIVCNAEAASRIEVLTVKVGTMVVKDLLESIGDSMKCLVIVSVRRWDTVLSLVAAATSVGGPDISAVLLTGASHVDEGLIKLLAGMNMPFPVLLHPGQAFDCCANIATMKTSMSHASTAKVACAANLMRSHINPDFLAKLIIEGGEMPVQEFLPPKLFQYNIFQEATALQKHIVLPEGSDRRVIVAAGELMRRRICKLTILGNADDIAKLAKEENIDLSQANIINYLTSPLIPRFVESIVKLRAKKGVTEMQAKKMLEDVSTFGTMLVSEGICDGMVSGAAHSTASTMRPAMQLIPRLPGCKVVSSIFFMLLPTGVRLFGDCAINVEPDAQQLGEIAAASVQTAKQFGIQPRVAMLSYATGDSNKGPLIEKVTAATKIAAGIIPNLVQGDVPLDGPIQFDAAVDPEVAAKKIKDPANKVAGRASVLIFPDLNTGNNTYKAVQQASKCIAMGPIMQGLVRPVNDLSRGCTVDDIINTVAITCLQSK